MLTVQLKWSYSGCILWDQVIRFVVIITACYIIIIIIFIIIIIIMPCDIKNVDIDVEVAEGAIKSDYIDVFPYFIYIFLFHYYYYYFFFLFF